MCNIRFTIILLACITIACNKLSGQCNSVTINTSTAHYGLVPQCNLRWRGAGFPAEQYNFCWVTTDGTFYRSTATDFTPFPYTDYPVARFRGKDLLFTGIANRKGDDNDPKMLAGGYAGAPLNSISGFGTYSSTQNMLTGQTLTKIQNDYNSDLVGKTDEILLILMIANDSDKGGENLLPAADYQLRLRHSNSSVSYAHLEGTPQYVTPNGNNKYFEFAAHTVNPPLANPVFSNQLLVWDVTTPPAGREKNIYCLLKIASVPPCSDESRVIDTFMIELTTPTGQMIAGSKSTYLARIGNSHDPNTIEVNQTVSSICGRQPEELQYTIHFQNIGSADANTVAVNLETDPALDPSTIVVTQAGIGYSQLAVASPLAQHAIANFTTGNRTFSYSVQQPNSIPPAVGNNATFIFNNASLQGVNASDEELSKGFITFSIKTRQAYSVIRNRAGIIFDQNPEVITNLAQTVCAEDDADSISCNQQLAQCKEQLMQCDGSYNYKTWLGWLIAAGELIIILLLWLRRKR